MADSLVKAVMEVVEGDVGDKVFPEGLFGLTTKAAVKLPSALGPLDDVGGLVTFHKVLNGLH